MAKGKRSYYTCPIKALVSEKFFALCNDFGPENVGLMTGDAPSTATRRSSAARPRSSPTSRCARGSAPTSDYVVIDEFHYYADRDRGVAWQIPLLALPRARFLLMSATLGPTERFEKALTKLTGAPPSPCARPTAPSRSTSTYRETPLHETILDLVKQSESAPVYVVNFTQRACAEEAQNLMSTDYSTKEEKRAITEALHEACASTRPYGKEVQRFVRSTASACTTRGSCRSTACSSRSSRSAGTSRSSAGRTRSASASTSPSARCSSRSSASSTARRRPS
jgi:superfamily II RNA helicase